MKSFVVNGWSNLFSILGRFSIFYMIRKIFPSLLGSYAFVEGWVIFNFVLAVIFFLSQKLISLPDLVITLVLIYGAIRIFEIIVYQINVLLFDQYRKEKSGNVYKLRGYRRLVILSLQNYVEILFWFSSFYFYGCNWFNNPELLHSLTGSFYYSLVTMSTLGYGDIAPNKTEGYLVVIAHTSVGVFMTLMIIARFISLLPKPDSMDEFESDKNRANKKLKPT